MKKTKLEKDLKKLGWYKEREGANHEVWTNGSGAREMIGRHREIPEFTARKILKTARQSPGNRG